MREQVPVRDPQRERVGGPVREAPDRATCSGSTVGTRFLEECIRCARRAGYNTLTLWTKNGVLDAARYIYEEHGFKLVEEEEHHSFGHDLVGQNWESAL